MKLLTMLAFLFVGFQSFSMTAMTKKEITTEMNVTDSNTSDRKKRINKKRKRKCKQWGKRSFAG